MIDRVKAGKNSQVILYKTSDGKIRLDVHLELDTVWLTQAQMAELFGRERSVITKHIINVFGEGELVKKSNVQNLHIDSSDKQVVAYSLDVIISVGYRVKSNQGTAFRQWATRVLRKYLVSGYIFEVENAGYQRFAVTLRNLSESYDRDADRIVAEHSGSDANNE